jgi:hypothetical protein
MNRLKRMQAEKEAVPQDASVFMQLRRFGIFKLLGIMFALGFILGIVSVHLIPIAVRTGLPPPMADKLPYWGFACGALVGFSAAVSHAAMKTLKIGLAIPLLLFALIGSVLSVVMSVLWAIAFLDVALIAAAITGVFVVLLAGVAKLHDNYESNRSNARN